MKRRLDETMVSRGLARSLADALGLIMAGQVSAGGRRLDKPGLVVDDGLELHIKEQPRYASRAGEKLASVAGPLGLKFAGKVVLDVGSSTGGFSDYALEQGAARIYCVDVGTNQLVYRLRQDARVVVMERTDIRDVRIGAGDCARLPEPADMAVVDVSFIKLDQVLDATAALVKPGGPIVAMAKPQFEADKPTADEFRGVIPMGEVRDRILTGVRELARERFDILGEADSAVAGSSGNVERFFVMAAK